MAAIPQSMNTTSESIISWWGKREDMPRLHLGASIIGRECERALWYSFRWATSKQFDGRMLRLFNRGHREEPQFLEELRGIGAEVYDSDPDTKRQHRFMTVRGHFGGSCDAIGRGFPEAPKTWAIVEFKTHNEKSFNELCKEGVKDAKPEHYAQMQVYMGLADLDRALYLAANKNTDELHSEWIKFDKDVFDKLVAKATRIIEAAEPPLGISQDPAWYKCKMCDHKDVCHKQKVPQKNCRTCAFATPHDDGTWLCEADNRLLDYNEQLIGCRQHLYIPPLITFATALDMGNGFVKYKHQDGTTIFANVTQDCDRSEANMTNDITACFTSDELAVAVPAIVSDTYIAQLKKEFGATVVSSQELPEDDDIPF
ncbi:PD-(D/E)XK nuclease family protein [Pseudomonas sp.]|uniref:PD-(D/E)XK nuclease family protein n=1 Tax=Pseudomonas sp. TaxID=306 RepID=UPI0025855AEA|nr:PD-(D/E)XK nuclease family protein [Pseudomonas sp.]